MKSIQTHRLYDPVEKLELILNIFDAVELSIESNDASVKITQTILWIEVIKNIIKYDSAKFPYFM